MSAPSEQAPRRIGIAELEARLGVHRATISRWCAAGTLVRPHYIGGLRRWWLHEIEAWEVANTRQEATVRP